MGKVEEDTIERFAKLQVELTELEFNELDAKFINALLYFFEQSLESIKNHHYELAYLGLCSVVEGLASRVMYDKKFLVFPKWLKKNKNALKLPDKIRVDKFIELVNDYWVDYKKTYGARHNFVKLIMDMYEETRTSPVYILQFEVIKVGKARRARTRTTPISTEEAYKLLRDDLIEVYDEYRCSITHSAKKLPSHISLMSRLGGHASGMGLTPQAFGFIVLEAMEYYLKKEPFISDKK